jgi:hypothetical protein
MIWIASQIPRNDQIFHHALMLVGVGKSTCVLLATLSIGLKAGTEESFPK